MHQVIAWAIVEVYRLSGSYPAEGDVGRRVGGIPVLVFHHFVSPVPSRDRGSGEFPHPVLVVIGHAGCPIGRIPVVPAQLGAEAPRHVDEFLAEGIANEGRQAGGITAEIRGCIGHVRVGRHAVLGVSIPPGGEQLEGDRRRRRIPQDALRDGVLYPITGRPIRLLPAERDQGRIIPARPVPGRELRRLDRIRSAIVPHVQRELRPVLADRRDRSPPGVGRPTRTGDTVDVDIQPVSHTPVGCGGIEANIQVRGVIQHVQPLQIEVGFRHISGRVVRHRRSPNRIFNAVDHRSTRGGLPGLDYRDDQAENQK